MHLTYTKTHYTFLVAVMGILLCAVARAQDISAQAEVNPSVVMVGERTEYTIRFIGTTQVPNLANPRVDGLAFAGGMSTSSFRQIINGSMTVETRATWSFSPTRTGDFTIPGRTTRISGQTVEIPPVAFKSIPMDEATRSRAILQLDLPEGPYYVGQALPARLGLFVRNDLTLSNIAFPERDGESFLNTEFDDNPTRTRTRIEGRIYEAFVWEFILTPIKSGPASLKFTQNIAIQESSSDSRFPSIFNLSRTRSEPLSLFTNTLEVEILQLPEEDRPDSFNDAIGDFNLSSELSSRELIVGEPVTLTLVLAGSGNFDRIAPPELNEMDNWRVYPPKVEFTAEGAPGLSGTKRFEYILIPQSESIAELPAIRYAWFNPESGQYLKTVLDPQPVKVKPSDQPADNELFMASTNGQSQRDSGIPEALLPIRPEPGTLLPHGPPWRNHRFWTINGVLAVVLLSLSLFLRKKRRLKDDNRLARRHFGGKKIRKSLQMATKAAREDNAAGFFSSAREAIQERVSHLSKNHVEAKTLVTSDCLDIIKHNDLPESVSGPCAEILQSADGFQFAGSRFAREELLRLNKALHVIITELNRFQK